MSSETTQIDVARDLQLERRISAVFSRLDQPGLRHVKVLVENGTVVLRGQVHSFYIKQIAGHTAAQFAGAGRVVDEIGVLKADGFRDPLRLRLASSAGIALVILALLSGCSKSEPGELAVFPVRGQITFAGKPVAGAQVVFHSKDGVQHFPAPRATSDREGNFQVTTYRQADGAAEGQYVVTAELRSMTQKDGEFVHGPNVLPPVYANPKTTTLIVRVESRDNEVPLKIVR